MQIWKKIYRIGSDFVNLWTQKSLDVYGAALCFYTLFVLGPLLLLSIFLLAIIFGEERSKNFFFSLLDSIGSQYLVDVGSTIVESQQGQDSAYVASIVGASTLVIGCVLFFNTLQTALNSIWEVKEPVEKNPIKVFFVFVMNSLVMPILIGLILIFVLSLRLIIQYLKRELPGFAQAADFLNLAFLSDFTSVFFSSLVIGVSMAWLLRSKISWAAACFIGVVMSLAMVFGKNIFGWYAQSQSVSSFYGAAGSIIVLMLWVYVSIRLFLLLNVLAKMLTDKRRLSKP